MAVSTVSLWAGSTKATILPLVGHLYRIQTEEATCRGDSIGHRDAPLVELHADGCGPGDLDDRCHQPAAGRIPQGMNGIRVGNCRQHGRNQPMQGALSVVTAVPKSMPSRTLMIATPCSPMFPETMT